MTANVCLRLDDAMDILLIRGAVNIRHHYLTATRGLTQAAADEDMDWAALAPAVRELDAGVNVLSPKHAEILENTLRERADAAFGSPVPEILRDAAVLADRLAAARRAALTEDETR